ncbi:MAG: alpha-L-fucosidase [Verrucomicrobiae bacterium]
MADATWFTNDRFGMFIHWGIYSNPAGIWQGKKITHEYSEWLQSSETIPRKEYQKLAGIFNPEGFDADEWIREAANAGMKYFLITSKHHDGFCLWPSKFSTYNVVDATPFQRDILGELAAACLKHGVKIGFYYSHWMDWDGSGGDVCMGDRFLAAEKRNPEYVRPTQAEFQGYWNNKCLPQVRELIELYDPWFFWFDSWNKDINEYVTPKHQDELIDLVHGMSDKCLVNSRINFEAPSEKCDFLSMMDNSFPETGFAKPWETSGTLNHSWGYHSLDFSWNSTEQLLKYLIGNASLGGNYQLNVGPMGTGEFQPAAIKRLREIGCWMAVNGESIYGTQANPIGKVPWGRVTMRSLPDGNTRLYLHLWNVTPGTALLVPGLKNTPISATVMESGQAALVEGGKEGIWVTAPIELKGIVLPVIALELRGNLN